MIKISAVPPEMVDDYWDVALPLLAKSFEYVAYKTTPEDVYEDIMTGRQSLWVAFEDDTLRIIGAYTVRIKTYPMGATASCEHLGGERMDEWAEEMSNVMERYIRDIGIEHMEIVGRRGWEKFLKPRGWSSDLVVFRKDI